MKKPAVHPYRPTKKCNVCLFLLLLLATQSCETEKHTRCYPVRVSTTIAEGTDATQVTADYHYDGDRVSRIIFSNFQTHFFDYYDDGNLRSVARKNVQTFQTRESIYSYEEGRAVRSDEYRVRLDRFTQENVDTVQTGYRLYTYQDDNVTHEQVFEMDAVTEEATLQMDKAYDYDAVGNMTTYVCRDEISGDTIEAFSYLYDTQNNPYKDLGLVFDGASYVNNVLQRTDMLTGEVYNHQIIYSATSYPDQINIKLETYLVEVIRTDYTCR